MFRFSSRNITKYGISEKSLYEEGVFQKKEIKKFTKRGIERRELKKVLLYH